jgi:type I restriction enzyme, S subunit
METEAMMTKATATGLPDGWKWLSLEKVADNLDNKRKPINAAERETRKGDVPYYGATGQVGWIDKHLLDEEVVLVGEDGAPFLEPGRAKAYMISGKSWVNNHAHILRARDGMPNAYLMHYLNILDYSSYVTGTTRLKLTKGAMNKIPVPVAPLPQQRRIVEAIELQLGRLDAAVARLQGAKARLKRYKQAVLKAAVEGRLTDPELADGEYPKDWRLVAIKDLAELLNGDRGKNYPSSKHYVQEGVPFINTGHIEPNGRLSQARMNYISRERFNILNAGKIVRGDIVYCLRGATLGKTAIVDLDEGAIASSLMIIRLQEEVSREFIYYYLTSDLGRRNIIDYDNGTAQPNLSAKSVGKYLVPLPPIEEQLRLVAHVRERLVQVENLEATLDAQLQQAVRLRQAVLKRAFEGRLG